MNDISLSEAYFMCAVGEKGKLFGSDTIRVAGLMSAVLSEMAQSGLIVLEDKKVKLINKPADDVSYFLPVYDHIKEMEYPDYRHIMQDYSNGLSDRHLNALTAAIGTGLADRGFVTKAKLGLLGGRTYFMPHRNVLPALTAELQVNIMFQTPVSWEDGLLWALLDKCSCIPKTFSEDLRKELRARIETSLHDASPAELSKYAAFADKLLTTAKANTVFIR